MTAWPLLQAVTKDIMALPRFSLPKSEHFEFLEELFAFRIKGTDANEGNLLQHSFVSYVAHAMGWSKTGNARHIFELGGFLKEKYNLTLPLIFDPR